MLSVVILQSFFARFLKGFEHACNYDYIFLYYSYALGSYTEASLCNILVFLIRRVEQIRKWILKME